MDCRNFLASLGAAASAATLTAKADAPEHAMSEALDRRVATPRANLDGEGPDSGPFLMHHEPRLPKMPERPAVHVDFTLHAAA